MADEKRIKIIKKTRRVVIKIGSGVLTDEEGLRLPFFTAISKEVLKLKQQGLDVVLVSSGAVASGMGVLKLKDRPQSLEQKQAVAAIGQPLLMKRYTHAFLRRGILAAQILLTREDILHPTRLANAQHTFKELFRLNVVPIVNENDSVAVDEIKVGDNDQLSAMVASFIGADLLLILTDIDGLYDQDPKAFKGAKKISLVEKIDDSIMGKAGGTLSAKSTGGMVTKLLAAKYATKNGVALCIVKGKNPNILSRVFNGEEVGTIFLPVI